MLLVIIAYLSADDKAFDDIVNSCKLCYDKNILKETSRRKKMAFPQEQIYTIDDIYALPDGQRAELIDGRLYMMALE